jgi:hypothetical protein
MKNICSISTVGIGNIFNRNKISLHLYSFFILEAAIVTVTFLYTLHVNCYAWCYHKNRVSVNGNMVDIVNLSYCKANCIFLNVSY